MVDSFWKQLQKEGMILGLSPMDGVTDAPMRYMVGKYGGQDSRKQDGSDKLGVDVLFTEFVSVDGLHFAKGEKRERILKAFVRARDIVSQLGSESVNSVQEQSNCDTEQLGNLDTKWPYEVAQVFGHTPEYFAEAAELVESLGFDGLDINMGCPAKNVSEHGSGAGLIRTPKLAQEIVRVTKSATSLPVSVKTRVGVSSVSEMEEWIEAIMETEPSILSLHGRTLKQMYTGEADWEAIQRAGEIVHNKGGIILGNGDVKSTQSAKIKVKSYGVDGVLIGRASFGNPGVFVGNDEPSVEQRFEWMREHAKVYEQVFDAGYFLPMRKHLAWYAKGFPGASELRQKLVRTNSAEEVEVLTKSIFYEVSNQV